MHNRKAKKEAERQKKRDENLEIIGLVTEDSNTNKEKNFQETLEVKTIKDGNSRDQVINKEKYETTMNDEERE